MRMKEERSELRATAEDRSARQSSAEIGPLRVWTRNNSAANSFARAPRIVEALLIFFGGRVRAGFLMV